MYKETIEGQLVYGYSFGEYGFLNRLNDSCNSLEQNSNNSIFFLHPRDFQ